MTQLAASSILANDFGCDTRTMVPWTCGSRQRGEMFSLHRVHFMLYLPDIGLLSGH
jgi:hypothetical protein